MGGEGAEFLRGLDEAERRRMWFLVVGWGGGGGRAGLTFAAGSFSGGA